MVFIQYYWLELQLKRELAQLKAQMPAEGAGDASASVEAKILQSMHKIEQKAKAIAEVRKRNEDTAQEIIELHCQRVALDGELCKQKKELAALVGATEAARAMTCCRRSPPSRASSSGQASTRTSTSALDIDEKVFQLWASFARRARRLAFKRRAWAFLGQHLKAIKERAKTDD